MHLHRTLPLLLGAMLLLSFATLFVSAEQMDFDAVKLEDIPDPPEMPCKAAMSMLTKRMMAGISTCSKKMKFKNGKEKAAKMSCIMRCVMVTEGILMKDGDFSSERMAKFIKKEVPPNLREHADPIISSCFKDFKLPAEPDEYCKAYEPLVKCLTEKITTVCASA